MPKKLISIRSSKRKSGSRPKPSHPKNSIQPQAPPQKKQFPVVGIGASAGGLEAFTALLKNLPSKTGMAFVYIQHLASGQKSLLTEILARSTKMPVHKILDEMTVEPNKVYIIPPDNYLTIDDDVLRLTPKVDRIQRPIDAFLLSLAQERKNLAIGVILSGSGSDGTEGIKAIFAEGGITFAEKKESAKYFDMPKSAIDSATVNFVLSPREIAEELVRIGHHPHLATAKLKTAEPEPKEESGLRNILALLKLTFGVDINAYKVTTVSRRISRRMVIHKIETLPEYLRFLRGNTSELQALHDDMLISVTSFFREPDTYKEIKEKVFPSIMKDRPPNAPIRIWVPGCSTGEEAYSMAISLREYMEKHPTTLSVQIFGTDLSQKNIDKARSGIYPEGITAEVSTERLNRFFSKNTHGYQINKSIREMCVFAKQDLIRDPPFSNVDVVSCRNVLIYLKPAVQKTIIPLFHYALKPKGYLILGNSESIGSFNDLFSPLNGKGPIYSKKLVPSRIPLKTESFIEPKVKEPAVTMERTGKPIVALQKEFERVLMEKYAPDGVIINSDMELLFVRGNMGSYFNPAPGAASLNLVRMVREELRSELQTAIYRAKLEKHAVRRERVRFSFDDQTRETNIEVIPVKTPESEEGFFMVLFEERRKAPFPKPRRRKCRDMEKDEKDRVIDDLQQDLASTKTTLQTIVEQQEATNEELKSALEEVQSSNEELQSTNEELETAKEELQSTNEELNTLNEELSTRNQELMRALNDQNNLFASMKVAVIMVDVNQRIRLVNPLAEGMFNLIPADVGRPIKQIRLRINVPDLERMLLEVVDKLVSKEQEIQDETGHWYLMRLRPYITEENKIDGAVISFVDIDNVVHSKVDLEKAYGFSQTVLATMTEPLVVLDSDLKIVSANRAFYKLFQVKPEEKVTTPIYELPIMPWKDAQFKRQLGKVLSEGKTIDRLALDQEFPNVGLRNLLINAVPLKASNEKIENILVTMEDITELRRREEELKHFADELQLLVDKRTKELQDSQRLAVIGETAGMVGHDLRNPLQSIIGELYLARSELNNLSSEEAKGNLGKSIEFIEDEISYINKIIADLQDYARPLNPSVEEVNLAEIIEGVLFKNNVPKNVKASCRLKDDAAVVMTNADLLRRILGNLVTNAVQAMPNGGDLTVEACRDAGDIVLTVEDTGNGVPEKVAGKLFTPLFTTKAKGQGFGLAVVKRLTEVLGGSVTFESEVGKGTKFILRLPSTKETSDK
jgi:two-component system CheB/CheR fusion protein